MRITDNKFGDRRDDGLQGFGWLSSQPRYVIRRSLFFKIEKPPTKMKLSVVCQNFLAFWL
jgi:hypothetical protein